MDHLVLGVKTSPSVSKTQARRHRVTRLGTSQQAGLDFGDIGKMVTRMGNMEAIIGYQMMSGLNLGYKITGIDGHFIFMIIV